MAAAVATIREALVDALTARLGSSDQQVLGYVIRNPTLPTVWLRPAPDSPVEYNITFGDEAAGIQKWSFLVEAYCGNVDDIGAQQKLDAYLSPGAKCIYGALVADKTLGGTVQSLKVAEIRSYSEFVRADGSAAIGASWLVEVYP